MRDKNEKVVNYSLDDTFQAEDLEERRLYINYDIDEDIIDNVVYHILRYNRIDREVPVEDRKPIVIYINSSGGSLTAGFSLIDAIASSKTPVYTVNLAECYSMGFLIFLAGEKRFSLSNSTYLCHDGISMAYGSMSKVRDRMEFETGQMEKHIEEYVLSRTSITKDQYKENYRKEWYFYPTEAKELGVVTHIVGIDCDIDQIL